MYPANAPKKSKSYIIILMVMCRTDISHLEQYQTDLQDYPDASPYLYITTDQKCLRWCLLMATSPAGVLVPTFPIKAKEYCDVFYIPTYLVHTAIRLIYYVHVQFTVNYTFIGLPT